MKKSAFILLSLFFLSVLSSLENQSIDYEPVFHLNFLTPNTSPTRMEWSSLIEDTLPQIGVEVKINEMTGWGNVGGRTYSKLPTYDDGGFDVCFTGWSSDFDWTKIEYFTSMQSYSNPTLTTCFGQYFNELNASLRVPIFHEIQSILYDDLPSIGILFQRNLYGMKEGLTGIDSDLFSYATFCSANWDDPDDHIIVYACPADFREGNIFVFESVYDKLWMQNVYSGLLRREQFGDYYEPLLAKNYSLSTDYLSITFNLDPNAKFSDGNQVEADDVKYSYQLFSQLNFDSKLDDWISSIEIVDSDTLIFHSNYIDITAFEWLSLGIIDKSEVEPLVLTHGYDIFDETPGTGNVSWSLVKSCGPFMLNSFDEYNVQLIPNPYWSELSASGFSSPNLSELNITFVAGKDTAVADLIEGDVDIIDFNYFPSWNDFNHSGVEGIIMKDRSHQQMMVNMKHPIIGTGELTPLGTPEAAWNLRKALSYAIDRDYIVETIMNGLAVPAIIPIPDSCYGFDTSLSPYSQNLDLAREYIEKAGYDLVESTPTTPTTPTTPDDTATIDFSGITVSIFSFLSLSITYVFIKRKNIF